MMQVNQEEEDDSSQWEDLDPINEQDRGIEEDDDETSWWRDLLENWKQHSVAIFVAVLATAATNTHLQRSNTSVAEIVEAPSLAPRFHEPHSHLDQYRRTANVSFCELLPSLTSNRLQPMDFHVQKDFIRTMKMHFQADLLQDNHYETVLQLRDQVGVAHADIDCMERQAQETSKTFIKGATQYAVEPSIASLYPGETEKVQAAHLTFTGFGAKFVNLSPKPVLLFWDGRNHENRRLLGEIAPFESLGTATTPGQSFSVSPVYDKDHAMQRWVLTPDEAVVYYQDESMELNAMERVLYQMQLLNKEFAHHYLVSSGRTWLSHFPRPFPVHPMWEASYIGQEHRVKLPIEPGIDRQRSLTLKVESVSPKVFVIDNFLSHVECDALIELAMQAGLKSSTVFSGSLANHTHEPATRSSTNSWIERRASSITERVYQRAAHVLKMDIDLFQKPIDEAAEAHTHSIAESLQVVRYKKGEEYTAHHDFVYPEQRHRHQPTRFATLLFYLNDEGLEGGHTMFPRAVNRHDYHGLRVKPEKGKAVLFYSMLEDGNVDDRSQHASEPIEAGEKVRVRCILDY